MAALLRLDSEAVPQRRRSFGRCKDGGEPLAVALHRVLLAQIVPVQDERCPLCAAAHNAYAERHLLAAAHRAERLSVFGKTRIVQGNRQLRRGAAQYAQQMRGARLNFVQLAEINADTVDIVTAVGAHEVRHVERQPAVVQQEPHKFGRCEGVAAEMKALVHPVERQTTIDTVRRRISDLRRRLKIVLHEPRAVGRSQKGGNLRVAPCRDPASVTALRLNHAPVTVLNGHFVVLVPALTVPAAEVDLILNFRHSIQI